MIVYHSDRLHERVANRGADEFEATSQEVVAQRLGFGGGNWNRRAAFVPEGLSVDESPDIRVKTAEFLLYREKRFRILNRRCDFQAITDDSFVGEQLLNFALIVLRNLARVEVVKSAAVSVALSQNRFPAQARLSTFENQKLK